MGTQQLVASNNSNLASYPYPFITVPRTFERMALIIPTLPHASAFERLGYDLIKQSDIGKVMESALLLAFSWWLCEGEGQSLDASPDITLSCSTLWSESQRAVLEKRSNDAEVLFRKTLPINDIPDGRHAAREAVTHLIDLVCSQGDVGRIAVSRAEVAVRMGIFQ